MGSPAARHQPMTDNEAMSKGQRLTALLTQLEKRRDELSAVLPPDIRFEAFHATINQAMRGNPDLLDCEPRSLINACVKAAYDGLRVDGREAAIVWEMATMKVPGQADRKVKQARYMPMYQGLVQQLLRGGLVIACEADVIYENDHYQLIAGSDRRVEHVPLTEIGADRGRMVAAYNVATLASGFKAVHWLLAADILDIQKESRSGWDAKAGCAKGVWKRWPREQWKKTVLRQHRKTLPVGRDIVVRDMEAADDFPQFAAPTPHPQLANPARPHRPSAIENRSGTEAGVHLDMGDDAQTIDAETSAQGGAEAPAEQAVDHPGDTRDLPADGAEWDMWQTEVIAKLRRAETVEAVNDLVAGIRATLDAAPDEIQAMVRPIVTDRVGDLLSQGDAE